MLKHNTHVKDLDYFTSGNNPKLLVHSGTHGDEFEVIEFVTKSLRKYERLLPDFIYVPKVSPSAIKLRTRVNARGNDLNRVFFSNSTDPEVKANMEIIKDHEFKLFLTIHEDYEFPEYYIYDWGYSPEPNELVLKHNQFLKRNRVGLLNGLDDPNDDHLNFEFVEGYHKTSHKLNEDQGFISSWILNRKIAEEFLLPEIPMQSDVETKEFIIDSFFEQVMIPMFK